MTPEQRTVIAEILDGPYNYTERLAHMREYLYFGTKPDGTGFGDGLLSEHPLNYSDGDGNRPEFDWMTPYELAAEAGYEPTAETQEDPTINPATGLHYYGSPQWDAEDEFMLMDSEEQAHYLRA